MLMPMSAQHGMQPGAGLGPPPRQGAPRPTQPRAAGARAPPPMGFLAGGGFLPLSSTAEATL